MAAFYKASPYILYSMERPGGGVPADSQNPPPDRGEH